MEEITKNYFFYFLHPYNLQKEGEFDTTGLRLKQCHLEKCQEVSPLEVTL